MNERIRKIHHQVMLWSDTPDCPDTVEWKMDIPREYTKKFAELIVKECAKIAIDCDVTECYDFRKGISQRIRENFGVKE